MPNFTTPFEKVFNALRFVTKPITSAATDPIKLYDRAGTLISTITSGWFDEEVTSEYEFEETVELSITHRAGVAFENAKFFVFRGYRYEAKGFPATAKGNPRLWVWRLKPVGVEAASYTVLRVSETHYLTAATDQPLQVSE